MPVRPATAWDLCPGTGLDLPTELLRVALGNHDVVGLPVEQVDGMVMPGVHRVAGDDCASQILEGVEQSPEAGDLVGLLTDVHLGQDQCVHVVAGVQEVDLPSLRVGRTPQRLPRRPRALAALVPWSAGPRARLRPPGPGRPRRFWRAVAGSWIPRARTVSGPAGRRPCRAVRVGPAVRRPPIHSPRAGITLRRGPRRPSVPGASREGAVLPRIPRVRDLREAFQQSRKITPGHFRMRSELIKGRGDQR